MTTQTKFWDVDETPIVIGGAGQEKLDRIKAEREAAGRELSDAAFAKCDRGRQREAVRKAVVEAEDYGITCDELAERWGVTPNAISGRFTELSSTEDDGPWIERRRDSSGKWITRPTRAGGQAAVWFDYIEPSRRKAA